MMSGNDTDNDNNPSITFNVVVYYELPVVYALMF
jgi:hypothetical protein